MNSAFQKLSLAIVLGALVALSSCSSKKQETRNQQAMLYYGAGTQSLMTKNYTDALTNLLKANELQPNDADILTNLGMAYYFKGETNLAIRHLNQALEINPNQTDSKLNLASIYYKEGDINKAETIYKNVLKDLTYDKQARTYFNLGILEAEKRKNYSAAENYFKLALKEDDNYCPAYNQLGSIQFRLRKFNTAEKTLYSGTRGVCVEYAANYYQHALVLIELGRLEDARLRLDEIDAKFKQTEYAELATRKLREISRMGSPSSSAPDIHASRKKFESPDF